MVLNSSQACDNLTVCGGDAMAGGTAADGGLTAIRQLAAWAPRLRGDPEALRRGIEALKGLICAAQRHGAQAAADFQQAAQQSAEVLPTLGEPLAALDFTEHRWVAAHREEAYSDWLEWIVAQLEPEEIMRVFGVRDPQMVSACERCVVTVERERRVRHGHEGSEGRLDLKIWFGDQALLVVEVKLTQAEDADTAKQAGYRASLEADPSTPLLKEFIMLALDAGDREYEGFKPQLWTNVCVELRLAAARRCRRKELLAAAMILAFVAAVEQNLLGFRSPGGGSPDEVAASLALLRTTDHLTRFVEAYEHEEENHPRCPSG